MYFSKKLFRHPALKEAPATRAILTGGTPISLEMAVDLRKVIFGSAAAPPRGEWTRTPLVYGPAREVSSQCRPTAEFMWVFHLTFARI